MSASNDPTQVGFHMHWITDKPGSDRYLFAMVAAFAHNTAQELEMLSAWVGCEDAPPTNVIQDRILIVASKLAAFDQVYSELEQAHESAKRTQKEGASNG